MRTSDGGRQVQSIDSHSRMHVWETAVGDWLAQLKASSIAYVSKQSQATGCPRCRAVEVVGEPLGGGAKESRHTSRRLGRAGMAINTHLLL